MAFELFTTNFRFLFTLTSIALLTACQNVQDSTIALDSDFEKNSSRYEVKKPAWQFTEKAYQQQLGQFSIASTQVSWQNTTQASPGLISSGIPGQQKQPKSLLNFILDDLTDNQSDFVKQMEETGKRDFAFDVNFAGQTLVQTHCRIMYLNAVTEFRNSENSEQVVSTDQQREHSYLGCSLSTTSQNWQLVVETKNNAQARMQLRGDRQSFQIKAVTDRLELINNQWVQGPGWGRQITGVIISANQLQQAALAFEGKVPRLWVHQQATDAEQALMIAANYSLLMYDWLDKEWRTN
ncbi:hypothetical protein [Rheinheimera soli]|uniref:Lipoprotein n=1 Tax=Rheinheimera soli TaxID=443616 RepID=A0ABU1VV60_9GAMM|nr:hypothetical protein [Rheinheimera soli]MDR7119609.1 hypothetical protein [Rheinheimera soli]